MLSTFANVFTVLTLGVGGIAGISLLVAGVLVMNLMLMSVRQRTAEIGLLKALGAEDRTVRAVFLVEAALLAAAGTAAGILLGVATVLVLREVYPSIPFRPPLWAIAAAASAAIGTALVFAWMPASAAARMEPVLALGRR
jgi:putative ABC transport system permease protein